MLKQKRKKSKNQEEILKIKIKIILKEVRKELLLWMSTWHSEKKFQEISDLCSERKFQGKV